MKSAQGVLKAGIVPLSIERLYRMRCNKCGLFVLKRDDSDQCSCSGPDEVCTAVPEGACFVFNERREKQTGP